MPSGDMDEEKKDEKKAVALDAGDIQLLKSYGVGPYAASIKALEADIEGELKKISELVGVRESETGLAPQSMWDLQADKQMKQEEHPLREWAAATRAARARGRASSPRLLWPSCARAADARLSRSPRRAAQTWAAARRSSTRARTTPST